MARVSTREPQNAINRVSETRPMSEPQDELLRVVEERVGDALRSVAAYREKEYELQYLRDDIAESYSEAEINEVFQELVLAGLGRAYLEKIFHAGRVECTAFCFEEATMFHFVTDGYSGRFVSVDRDVEVDLDAFVASCKAAIGG